MTHLAGTISRADRRGVWEWRVSATY